MHGFPCAALQHCFGSPTDVADSASSPTSEDGSDEDASAVAAVTVQPGPKGIPASKDQHAGNCNPERAKRVLNGANSNGHLGGYSNGDHPSQISIRCHCEDDFEDGCPDLGSSYPHIPRPSIIKQRKDSLLQEGLSEETDQTEAVDGTLSGCMMANKGGISMRELRCDGQGRSQPYADVGRCAILTFQQCLCPAPG
ncbi:hypothetical protein ANANG_G00143010 [Anguilla anguilla]|uniref:Uncharacterized protein n=1 Tax=Anguilla anguilla TaxID=7936 RepID=A0A9D3MD33_ANGAN|nr:hypothetical protein ANANG_G00143010 [Anguilla anguilla]